MILRAARKKRAAQLAKLLFPIAEAPAPLAVNPRAVVLKPSAMMAFLPRLPLGPEKREPVIVP